MLDNLDPAAERIGAVNTVVNVSGKLVGIIRMQRVSCGL